MYVHVLHMYLGAAVSGSARLDLEGDKSRFQRMPSVDSFNQVGLHHAQIIFASNVLKCYDVNERFSDHTRTKCWQDCATLSDRSEGRTVHPQRWLLRHSFYRLDNRKSIVLGNFWMGSSRQNRACEMPARPLSSSKRTSQRRTSASKGQISDVYSR